MDILLHTCCAPCLTYVKKTFEEDEDVDRVVPFWFNPNIHPFTEYEKRLEALMEYEEETGTEAIYDDRYMLSEFLEGALRADPRCRYCYRWRLEETAKRAKKEGFDAFSTTLILSPYQDHESIKQIGGEEGKKHGLKFIYTDMTDGFRESHEMTDELELYKQGYCGCIFSEKERYEKDLVD